MRLDRLITLNLVQPARRTLQAFGSRPSTLDLQLSILMYHSVSEQDEPLTPYYITNTRPDAFRAQMRFLAENHYHVTDLETAFSADNTNKKCVVITFDDGFRDFYTTAFPILREYGFTATMYLPTALIAGFPRPSDGKGTKGEANSDSSRSGSISSQRGGLESLGKRGKEFAGGEGLGEAERVGTSESLGQGEVHSISVNFPRASDLRESRGVHRSADHTNQRENQVNSSVVLLLPEGEGRDEGERAADILTAENKSRPSRHSFKGRECMTWDEIRTLAQAGIHFGSHTLSHPKLYDLDWPQIETELAESRRALEKELNREITTFAYPFAYPQADARFTTRFETLLKKTGYTCNVTTRIGRAKKSDEPFSLRRLPMNSFDDPTLFQAKLEGGYDWLAQPQALVKKIKHWTSRPE